LAQLRIFGIEDASLIFLAVSDHQRSTHTNYLIEFLKSDAPCQRRAVKYRLAVRLTSSRRGRFGVISFDLRRFEAAYSSLSRTAVNLFFETRPGADRLSVRGEARIIGTRRATSIPG
jgi:hypothetical protein